MDPSSRGSSKKNTDIEMVEDKTKKYFASVRFHPESLYLYDEKHNKIFEDFIESCR